MADAELKYEPVSHDHEAFLAKALKRKGFKEKYDELGVNIPAKEIICLASSPSHSGSGGGSLGTTKSAVSVQSVV